jgi:hypothetical protein
MTTSSNPLQLRQGDPGLLAADTAQELLASAIPARLAYVTPDGLPRIVPTWFVWNGTSVVMATWVAGPHITYRARRIDDIAARPDVTISIDTDTNPPVALQIRGRARVEIVDEIVDEYRTAAEKYLGADAAAEMFAALEGAPATMARISVEPSWVGLLDFETRLPGPLGGVVASA